MKIEHVDVKVIKQEQGKKVVDSEVFLTCGKPYINIAFHIEGDAQIEPGVYTLSFEPQLKAKAAKG